MPYSNAIRDDHESVKDDVVGGYIVIIDEHLDGWRLRTTPWSSSKEGYETNAQDAPSQTGRRRIGLRERTQRYLPPKIHRA